MEYYVTYCLYTENFRETGINLVERFTYFPTMHDLNEVGDRLCEEYQMDGYLVCRGREIEGKWVLNEGD